MYNLLQCCSVPHHTSIIELLVTLAVIWRQLEDLCVRQGLLEVFSFGGYPLRTECGWGRKNATSDDDELRRIHSSR